MCNMDAQKIDFNVLEQELAQIPPAVLADLEQLIATNPRVASQVVENILDTPRAPTRMETQIPTRYVFRRPEERKGVNKGLLRRFDPLARKDMPRVNERNLLRTLFDVSRKEGEANEGRRYIQWNFVTGLKKPMVDRFMEKINANVRTAFYLRHTFEYVLQNIEDGSRFVYYYVENKYCGSPWFNTVSEAKKWLEQRENFRLDPDNLDRPNTKWIFVEFFKVSLKVVLDRQPLVGNGVLPDWLKNRARGGHQLVC